MNPYSGAHIDIETAADTKYGGIDSSVNGIGGKYPRVLPAIRNDHSAGGISNNNILDMNNTMGEFGSVRQSHAGPTALNISVLNNGGGGGGLDLSHLSK